MKITRLYTDENQDSVFELIEIDLKDHGDIGNLSVEYPVNQLQAIASTPKLVESPIPLTNYTNDSGIQYRNNSTQPTNYW